MVLSGWKEISGYVRCGVRTVQRWEGHGLPIHRPTPGKRSHVIAYSEELDWWVRDHEPRKAGPGNVIVSIANAERLRQEAQTTCAELRVRLDTLRQTMAVLRQRRRKFN